jgi:hypothetical protein
MHHSHGMCRTHWKRLQKHGQLERVLPERDPVCTIEGCDRPHRSLGLCEAHYRRMRHHGTAERLRAERDPVCTVEGCGDAHAARGLCELHYRRVLVAEKPPCGFGRGAFGEGGFGGCTRPAERHGLCQTHDRWRRRRAQHPTLSAEVESWGLIGDVPLEDYVRGHDWARLRNRRQRLLHSRGAS